MRLCPNCNEWFDDSEDICPHCGYRYAESGANGQIIDNEEDASSSEVKKSHAFDKAKKNFKETLKSTVEKYNPWAIALTVLVNLAVLLSIIDLFVSDYCWSCYPVMIMALGFCLAKIIVAVKTKKSYVGTVNASILIMTGVMLFYSLIVTVSSKAGQDLSYLTFYVLPLIYTAYIAVYLVLFFLKKITTLTLMRVSASLTGVCFIITFAGGIILKAQGFALASSIFPFALALLVFINSGLYAFLSLKKKLFGNEEDSDEVHIDYEIIDDDLTGESKKDKDDKKEDKSDSDAKKD